MDMNQWVAPVASIVISIAIPYVVNLCKKIEWSSNVKRWIAIAFSLIGGAAVGILAGAPTPETFVTWMFSVVGGVQIAYSAFKTVGVTSAWLDALEGIGSNADKAGDGTMVVDDSDPAKTMYSLVLNKSAETLSDKDKVVFYVKKNDSQN